MYYFSPLDNQHRLVNRCPTDAIRLPEAPVHYLLLFQEGFGIVTLQHREGRQHTGLGTGIGNNGNRSRCVTNRPAGPRVEDMTVSDTIFQQETMRIATGGNAAAQQLDDRGIGLRIIT